MNENTLRAMLRDEAQRFNLDLAAMATVRPNRTLHLQRVGLGLAGAAVVAATVMVYVGGSGPRTPHTSSSQPVYLQLAGYEVDSSGAVPSDLERHLQCMRDEGFDLPDPVRRSDGWAIRINDPESMGLRTDRWNEAAFGTCALIRSDRKTYDEWVHDAIMNPRPRHDRP